MPKAAGTVYAINGAVHVGEDMGGDAAAPRAGAREGILNIEAGVTLYASAGPDALIVNRGSKIYALGTAEEPIIMTAKIDVEGGATDKWSPEEGEATIALLSELRRREVEPNLYVVTPFVVVKDGLHRAILESRVLVGWVPDPKEWIKERVGTVHTVQGREAEAVGCVFRIHHHQVERQVAPQPG